MKLKSFAVATLLLVALPLAVGLVAWAAQGRARSTAAFPAPSGNTGTIVEVRDGFVWVRLAGTEANRTLHARVDASTIILKGGFSRYAALSEGDILFVDPTFATANVTAPDAGVPGTDPASAAPPSANKDDASAGRHAGASANLGSSAQPLPAGAPGSGRSAQPSKRAQPGDTSTEAQPSGLPGDPAARNPVPVARLIWVASRDEALTSGFVTSVAAGRVTLQAGSSTFTVTIDKSTELRRAGAAGGPPVAATAAGIRPGQSLLVAGATLSGSDTITARAVLIQPAAPGAKVPPR
jgi:hypothetical protein